MINRPILGVTIDAGGVLVQPDPAFIADALHPYGGTGDFAVITQAQYVATPPEPIGAIPGAPIEPDVWWRHHAAIARYCGVADGDLSPAVDAMFAVFRMPGIHGCPLPGAREGLAALAAAGYVIAVVTNHDGTMAGTLAAAGICQVGTGSGVPVAAVVDSGAVGFAKPDPRIFRIALDALGLAPAEVVHIGDAAVDINGAMAAGMRPVHFDPFEVCGERSMHMHVRAIRELVEA